MDLYYLPRSTGDRVDYLYGEDTLKKYTKAYSIEMYLENVMGMDGEGDFISKFGLEIRDEIQLLVSRRRFKATVPQLRPNEGDLIYVPLLQNFFEIIFVEHENNQAMFYTLGRGRGGNIYVYSLKLKQYVFSNEIIDTGITEIDEQIRDLYPRTNITLNNVSGQFLIDEIVYQGNTFNTSTAHAYVFNYTPNTNINIYRTHGLFDTGVIIGMTSGATANVNVASEMATMDNAFEDIVDNNRIETESDAVIDFSSDNPFGSP